MARQGGHHRHGQGLGFAAGAQNGDEEDPEDSPAMKDRRRRRRAAIFEVLPVLHDLDNIQRKISRERRVKLTLVFLVTAFLLLSLRYYSRSGDGGHASVASRSTKPVKPSNLNKLDMPMRTVGGVRQGTRATELFSSFLVPEHILILQRFWKSRRWMEMCAIYDARENLNMGFRV
jgi:hypothetical protein